jgi:hypothetical protein
MDIMNKNKKYLILFSLLSVSFHALFLGTSLFRDFLSQFEIENEVSTLKIRSLRHVGEAQGVNSKVVYLPDKAPIKETIKKAKSLKKSLSTKSIAADFNPFLSPEKALIENRENSKSAIKSLSLNNNSIRSFLKGTPNFQSASQYLESFESTDSTVKLEVPKGIKESELNKHELVFYSFQKRTAQVYINTFYNKLNEFKVKNPHLRFPISTKKEKMTGRVIYDKDGNIVKINMIKWTDTKKLQDFFMDVLQDMTALPNPPKAVLKDGEFTVFFSLIVNS